MHNFKYINKGKTSKIIFLHLCWTYDFGQFDDDVFRSNCYRISLINRQIYFQNGLQKKTRFTNFQMLVFDLFEFKVVHLVQQHHLQI